MNLLFRKFPLMMTTFERMPEVSYRLCNCLISTKVVLNKNYDFIDYLDENKVLDISPISCFSSLKIIGSGSRGAPSSLFVSTSSQSILFNCGEGITQTITTTPKALFFTNDSWKNISGTLELLLADPTESTHLEKICIYGPHNVGTWLKKQLHVKDTSSRPFEFFDSSKLEKIYKGNISVKLVNLSASSERKKIEGSGLKKQRSAFSFICQTTNLHWPIVPDKLSHHNLNEPKFTRLAQKRENMANSSLKEPKQVFLVVDVPNEDFLDSLLMEKDFFVHQLRGANNEADYPIMIVHFSSAKVMKAKKYREWTQKFPPSTSHIVINEESSCLGYYEPNFLQQQLHNIYPKSFPLLSTSYQDIKRERVIESLITDDYGFTGKTYQASSFLQFDFQPYPQLVCQDMPTLDTSEDFLPNRPISSRKCENSLNQEYPEILFLGTGSSKPSKYRNASGILMRISNSTCVLMDCGQSTFSQFVRFYGHNNYETLLRNLSLIYISHSHYDHYAGLVTLLIARKESFPNNSSYVRNKLYIVLSKKIYRLINWACENYGLLEDKTLIFVKKEDLIENEDSYDENLHHKLCQNTNMEKIAIARVPHSFDSTSVAWTHKDGWKVVYSGDCLPNNNIIEIGKDCNLLIHEATYEDELQDLALLKKHSTQSQAIKVGEEINAKYVILTHFSQRSYKIPYRKAPFPKNVSVAFDFMKVTFYDLPFLSTVYPAAKLLFLKEFEGLSERIHHRTSSDK